ncbi:MAG: hypothetical protein ACRCW3_00010 [Metamycoplasmataceae bacterium]
MRLDFLRETHIIIKSYSLQEDLPSKQPVRWFSAKRTLAPLTFQNAAILQNADFCCFTKCPFVPPDGHFPIDFEMLLVYFKRGGNRYFGWLPTVQVWFPELKSQ